MSTYRTFLHDFIHGAASIVLSTAWNDVMEAHGRTGLALKEIRLIDPMIQQEAEGHAWMLLGRLAQGKDPTDEVQRLADAAGREEGFGTGCSVMHAALDDSMTITLREVVEAYPDDSRSVPHITLMKGLLERLTVHLAPVDLAVIAPGRVIIAGDADGTPTMALLIDGFDDGAPRPTAIGTDIATYETMHIDLETGEVFSSGGTLKVVYTALLDEVVTLRSDAAMEVNSFPFPAGAAKTAKKILDGACRQMDADQIHFLTENCGIRP